MFVRLQQIRHIQMQVGRHIDTAFDMSVHGQDFQRIDFLCNRTHLLKPAFLHHFPDSHLKEVPLTVRMASQPGPGMIDVMVCHQDLGPLTVNHPGRRSHMRHGIVPCKYIPFFPQAPEKDVPVPFLLFIKRTVLF